MKHAFTLAGNYTTGERYLRIDGIDYDVDGNFGCHLRIFILHKFFERPNIHVATETRDMMRQWNGNGVPSRHNVTTPFEKHGTMDAETFGIIKALHELDRAMNEYEEQFLADVENKNLRYSHNTPALWEYFKVYIADETLAAMRDRMDEPAQLCGRYYMNLPF